LANTIFLFFSLPPLLSPSSYHHFFNLLLLSVEKSHFTINTPHATMADQPDIERADVRRGSRISRASLREDYSNLDEYGKLVKYVSTFRDASLEQAEAAEYEERRIWYKPWQKRKVRVQLVEDEAGRFPDDWLITNVREGLSSEVVNQRRRRSGWNELVSEKENPIAKVLSYFRGPILYGMSSSECHVCRD
jgi:H+-transporting ATPase